MTASELASIAQEEQVKLVQHVFLTSAPAPRIVVFAGVERGNGCSRLCAETALMLAAQSSGTVCLVDADLRSPTLHRIFGLDSAPGFAEAMVQLRPVPEYIRRWQGGNLHVMPSGSRNSDFHGLFISDALRLRIKELRQAFDFILIDTPPLNCFADASKLGSLADGVVLVMQANSTRRDAARKAKEDIVAGQGRVLGAVLNRRTFPIPEAIYRRL